MYRLETSEDSKGIAGSNDARKLTSCLTGNCCFLWVVFVLDSMQVVNPKDNKEIPEAMTLEDSTHRNPLIALQPLSETTFQLSVAGPNLLHHC